MRIGGSTERGWVESCPGGEGGERSAGVEGGEA